MDGEPKATPPHEEVTIHKLLELQPGMAALMKEVGERYTRAYYAAKGGNWKLSAYQLNQVRVAFKTAKVTRPKFTDDLTKFDSEYLMPIFKAIHAKDWGLFEEAYENGIEGSDFFHDKNGYPYIRYLLPGAPPADLYLGPPESFKRERTTRKSAPQENPNP